MTNRTLGVAAMVSAAALWVPQVVLAHTPYLLPNAFDAERDHVTLQAALTEDDYFNPDIAIRAPSYVETTPSGQRKDVPPAMVMKDMATFEAPLPDNGTYRFSTGLYVARSVRMAEIGGHWLMIRQPGAHVDHDAEHAASADVAQPAAHGADHDHEHKDDDGPPSVAAAEVPAGARTIEVQNIQTAETYVSKGAPTDTALRVSGEGLELKPVTHPNAIYVDQGFAFQLLIDGKPAAGTPFSVYRSGDIYDDHKVMAEMKTGADGAAKVSFDRPGVYLLTTHYPFGPRSPDGAPTARNYVYSLTFEVTR
ncbi:MAG: DUF4198 domain-containing protein [Caulobacteraceae bacterium]